MRVALSFPRSPPTEVETPSHVLPPVEMKTEDENTNEKATEREPRGYFIPSHVQRLTPTPVPRPL